MTLQLSFFFLIFYWRIIALQYCTGFCHISTEISQRDSYISSLSHLPPISHPVPPHQVVTEHWMESVSLSKSPLTACFTYGNIYVSVLFSQIILPSPSPTEFKSLFFMSVSHILPCVQDHQYHLSRFHVYVLIIKIFVSF